MGYKVIGKLKHDGTTFEHGESVSASKVGGKDNFDQLVANQAVVTDEEFAQLYPEQDGEVIDATGTPSNLREVEGTKLQANMPEDETEEASDEKDKKPSPPNPANPPEVKGAGNVKAAAKEQEQKQKAQGS